MRTCAAALHASARTHAAAPQRREELADLASGDTGAVVPQQSMGRDDTSAMCGVGVGGEQPDAEAQRAVAEMPAFRRYLFDMRSPLISRPGEFTKRSICADDD